MTALVCQSCGAPLGESDSTRCDHCNAELAAGDQAWVLESFLRSRGNLRYMERELGISYPTVRARVEALIRALGFGPRDEGDAPASAAGDVDTALADAAQAAASAAETIQAGRREILEQLSRHELSAEEAAEAIRALGRTR